MKLELAMHAREIQRDWYSKRGISIHGFHVIAQIAVDDRRIEVLDLWSEDTKQDAWFFQSALDVGFAWTEKPFPISKCTFLLVSILRSCIYGGLMQTWNILLVVDVVSLLLLL